MYRRSDWLMLVLLLLGFILLYGGTRLNVPVLIYLGNASIGSFLLVAGISTIINKRIGFETRQRNFGPVSMYTGLAAQLIGFLFVAFALLVFLLTGIAWFYPGGIFTFLNGFFGKPLGWGILLLGIGLVLVAGGFITLLAGSAGYYKGLADKVERFSGVIPLLLGLGLAISGLLLVMVPGFVLSTVKNVLSSITQWIFH